MTLTKKEEIILPKEKQVKLSFDPVPHKYYDDGGLVYTSVTSLIGGYKKPFNKKYWSMYTQLRNAGLRVRPDIKYNKYIIVEGVRRSIESLYEDPINVIMAELETEEWQRLTDIACDRGNKIHDGLEKDINDSKGDSEGKTNDRIKPLHSIYDNEQYTLVVIKTNHQLEKTGLQHRYPSIFLHLSHFINNGCTIYAEKRVYSTTFQLAGTIDVLIVKGNKFAVLDWKTNKDTIIFESGYFKKYRNADGQYVKSDNFIKTDNRLLAPLDFVPECKGMIYSLQVSTYAAMMIRWGYKLVPNGLTICHLKPNEDPKFIAIPYLEDAVKTMLMDHYNKNVVFNVPPRDVNFGIR